MSSESDVLDKVGNLGDAGVLAETEPASAEGAPTATEVRPARTKTKASKGRSSHPPAPRSRRIPLNTTGPKSSRLKAAPPSRRFRVANEASIPPTWSDLDDHGKRIARADTMPSIAPAPLPTKIAARLDEDAIERAAAKVTRPAVSPYVKAAGALAAVVCIVLAGRGFVRHPRPLPLSPSVAAAAIAPPAVDPIPPVPETVVPPPAAPSEASAEEEKTASLLALQQGKVEDAIGAGERATTLDPTDADAWRILGAAYQDHGDFAAARRSFLTCTKSATHGDIRECAFLLR